jgi:lipopolysaccharide/colanic/teichoic acid biosynthesis glycosyltransferase
MTPSLDHNVEGSTAFLAETVKLRNGIPRLIEALTAVIGLVTFAPLILTAAAAVALTSRGSAVFRQKRVGLRGQTFVIYKLRTMRASSGPQITSKDDARVTNLGRLLRFTKVDELPQLWNVLKGDMSLVGPRPEVPRYVNLADSQWTLVLLARPGITDPVSMRLRNEEELLQAVEGDRELFYLQVLQPLKLKGYIDYLQKRNWWCDVKVLWLTILAVMLPGKLPSLTLKDVSTEDLG